MSNATAAIRKNSSAGGCNGNASDLYKYADFSILSSLTSADLYFLNYKLCTSPSVGEKFGGIFNPDDKIKKPDAKIVQVSSSQTNDAQLLL